MKLLILVSNVLFGMIPYICNTHLCSCELVSKEGIGGECEEGDQYWSGGPEIDTHGIQVLDALEASHLFRSQVIDLSREVTLPRIELDDPYSVQNLIHDLSMRRGRNYNFSQLLNFILQGYGQVQIKR